MAPEVGRMVTQVRMGELAVSCRAGDELMVVGLGSCIGLALVDRPGGVAALAHVVLPESQGVQRPRAKYADLAASALLEEMEAVGALRRRVEAVLIGGARMFSVGSSFDIGARNAHRVRAALGDLGVKIHAEDVGGNRGRSARIVLGQEISSQLAGSPRESLLSLSSEASISMAPTTAQGTKS